MIVNEARLKEELDRYKQHFTAAYWEKEKYKWEAVQAFQDNWDVNHTDFAAMLGRALAKTGNLLASLNNYPTKMLSIFAEKAPEEVRAIFLDLFDESQDVISRIDRFKQTATRLLESYGNGEKQHYQNENAISTYLWLRYPDKYFIYKFNLSKAVSMKLESGYTFKKGAYSDNVRNFFQFYTELSATLLQDQALVQLLHSHLADNVHRDEALHTLTIDFGYFISQEVEKTEEAWSPADYSPNLSVEQWVNLLKDESVFQESSLAIMQRMLDIGGQATCTQLAIQYGETKNFYNVGSSSLAKRVAEATGCPVYVDAAGNTQWWPILYIGKPAEKEETGSYVWKLRDELVKALEQINPNTNYWWLNANPKIWSFSNIAVGETRYYTLLNENGNKRRIYQNFLDAKVGDIVIGYESQPVKQIVSIARVHSKVGDERIYFEKIEELTTPIDYHSLKACPELAQMEYFINPNGSLFKLTTEEHAFIMDLIREANPTIPIEPKQSYTKQNFLDEVYVTEEKYDRLTSVLKHKKNIILQGAPGVGKTFAAKRLAYSLMGERDESRVEFVQFHQNYSYEDFMMGYKPTADGFELRNGVFYKFCQKAANQPDKDFYFIIDEINRGNMSKIFGELLMLIEAGYRGTKATLAYIGMTFTVPERLHIIGMMNTADRSLAMIDYALRRRFSFISMDPGFDSVGFRGYQASLANETFDELIRQIVELNKEIIADKSLGAGFCIGHSYFCGATTCSDAWMQEIVEYDILPMLNEYWFDEPTKVQRWENILRGVFQ
jgi:5-methylcytosine-specific restriction protein B